MTEERAAVLRSISDSDYTLADPGADIRGKHVVDMHGERFGSVKDLMIDDVEHKVRFLKVASGGFLGMGETELMVPVEAISTVDEDDVHIDKSREHAAGAPHYDPEVTEDHYWDDLYDYYGYGPYFGPGYMYPPIPHYR
jgi:sporulation protein YlmC with PRC-barrel domain